jgi:hypothetical protein
VCLLAPLSIHAQQRPAEVFVEGDVYLVMRNGDIKRAAANVVRLLSADTVRNVHARLCPPAVAIVDSLSSLARSADSLVRVALQPRPGVPAKQIMAEYDTAQKVAIMLRNMKTQTTDNAARQIRSALMSSVIAESKTGIDAHYRLDKVAPGAFILWAETTIGDTFYQWLTPVTVATAPVRMDMDNSTAGVNKAYCGLSVSPATIR